MPLGFSFFGRRRSTQGAESPGPTARNRSNSATGKSAKGGSRSSSATDAVPTQDGNTFRIKVPSDARPGQSIRVRAPDGRLVEIDLPTNCKPGQTITIQIEGLDLGVGNSTLKQLHEVVSTNFNATCATCRSMRERLKEELELQKGLWASAATAPQSAGYNQFQLSVAGESLDLSQTQSLVVAAAEVGDCKQLLAALAEAKKFHVVSSSLYECCQSLNTAEEAMVIWQCLMDALHVGNRHEISVWVEEAQALGLVVPAGLSEALLELQRQEEESLNQFERSKQAEQKLKFAMECGDVETLRSAISEAETFLGLHSQLVNQAKAQLRSQTAIGPRNHTTPSTQSNTRSSSSDRGPEAGIGAVPQKREGGAYNHTPREPDDGKSVRELLEQAKQLGIETRGCTDRSDLERLIANATSKGEAKAPAPPPSQAQGFKTQIPATQAARNPAADTGTVWSRRTPPSHIYTKRGKALYLLGLDPSKTFTQAEIRSAYRKVAMECHPDRQHNHERQEQAKELFQQVKEAFDFMCSS